MKQISIIFLSLLLSISFTQETNAQLLKKLKNRVQQAAEDALVDKAGEKTTQETEKALDSLLEIDPNYQSKNQGQLPNIFMQSDTENIAVEDIYQFNTNVTYEMKIESNSNPSSIDYSMWFSDHDNYMGTEMKNIKSEGQPAQNGQMSMLTILDDKNQAMLIIMEEQKIAQIISMEKIKEIGIEEDQENKSSATSVPKINKTGNSKKIQGYNCEEFETQTEEGKTTMWITQDLRLFQKNMFANLSKSLGGNTFQKIPESAKGFMMEMYFQNTETGEKTSMIVKDISKKNRSINTKDYQFMNLSKFMK